MLLVASTYPIVVGVTPSTVLLLRLCVPARFANVSVAAGMLTITVPRAPATGSTVIVPLVALPIVSDPSVPLAPSVGADVQDGVAPPITCPAPQVSERVFVESDRGGLKVAVRSLIAGCAVPKTPEEA